MATAVVFVSNGAQLVLTRIAAVASVCALVHVNSRRPSVKFAAVFAAVFCIAGAAQAQQIDISNLKCKEFIDLPKDTIANVTLWLDGYFTDEEDPAVVDFDKMKAKVDKLVSYCAQNPRLRVMTAAEDLSAK